jgi:valyl-tRNA synthetase
VIDGEDLAARKASQDTLYTCIDQGLKLLHPFMPFITEDLYQRLARRPGSSIPSIMVESYPKPVKEWDNLEACQDFELVNKIVHASRSLLSDYDIKSNATSNLNF